MFKPHTIEQFKILQYLKRNFEMEHFILSPVSRNTLMLEDAAGDQIAFTYREDCIKQVPIPEPSSDTEIHAFLEEFRNSSHRPVFHSFEDATRWWLNHPNPLTYQQLFGFPDDLYRHFLTHKLLDDEEAMELASRQLVTELEYNDLRLWYRNGHICDCWLGPYGVDGTGNSYQLILDYRKPVEHRFLFYVKDEYYCFMNGLPYPYEN